MNDKPTNPVRKTIPTPLPLLMRRVQFQVLPIASFVICLFVAGLIMLKHGGTVGTIGAATSLHYNVHCPIDGRLIPIAGAQIEIYAHVVSGETIARLDEAVIDDQVAQIDEEIKVRNSSLEKIDAARKKLKPGVPADDAILAQYLATESTIHAEIASRETKITQLAQKKALGVMKAPVTGYVSELHRRPGQDVQAGQIIMAIVPDKPEYIRSYIRQYQNLSPSAGMSVDIRSRTTRQTYTSKVQTVGTQIVKVPDEQLRDVRSPEWGLPVHISIPDELKSIKSGEIFDLYFHPGNGTPNSADAGAGNPANTPANNN